MPKAGSGLMAGTILCMKIKASCFSSASLPETATRRFEDGGRGQLSQCRRGADGMGGFSHLPEPTRTTSAYQELPSGFCSEQYSFLRVPSVVIGYYGGQTPETAFPLKPELR